MYGSISSYLYIINSPKRIDIIIQSKQLVAVIGYIEPDFLGVK